MVKRRNPESKLFKAVQQCTRVDECVLCGAKMTSACDSHVVPAFVLKRIAENGHVAYGFSLHPHTIQGLKAITGVKDAHTFRLICRRCDNQFFRDYENEDNLRRFELLSLDTQKKILCEMAVKAHLAHLSSKYQQLVMADIANQRFLSFLENDQGVLLPQRQDMNQHLKLIRKFRRAKNSDNNPFVVLFDSLLNYETKLASQTVINFNFDLKGHRVFDPRWVSEKNECRFFYLMILPCGGKTRVLFFVEKADVASVSAIVDDFYGLTTEERRHFLFVSLIIHDEHFYMSPSFADRIIRTDKALVRLYKATDKSMNCQIKIKDFRRYNNYLLREYNV